MLQNIKSDFAIANILSLIIKRKKLKLIKYNKFFQKMPNINIETYKSFNGKYILYDPKISKRGKEYNKLDQLIYVGEYLHGERSGRGTEYDPENENEIYEGEYLHGERNGKGTEYQNREIIFEGEYKNGKRYEGMEYWNYYDGDIYTHFEGVCKQNGKTEGKIYTDYGNVLFEGEFLNGKKDGIGKEYNHKGLLIFEGEYLDDYRWNGKEKEYNDDGTIKCENKYLNGKRVEDN